MFMLNLTKKVVLALMALCASLPVLAQDFNGLWRPAPAAYAEIHGKPALKPSFYKTFTTAEETLKSYLQSIPEAYAQARIIVLPQPDGSYREFRIWGSPMMETPLALKYPGIKTYTAEAVNNRQVTAKIDYTLFGFHAMVFDGVKSYLIDPYGGKADGAYIVYYRNDYSRAESEQQMVCEAGTKEMLQGNNEPVGLAINGSVRKQYRLALAADSEYCVAVAGANPTKAAVLSRMTTTMNRVNGVYEREFAVRMVFVANVDTLIFNTATPDPYTNSSGSAMLAQNQVTVNARIGAANYDIGHVFSTGGGGIAQQGCVCFNSAKARGVTGSASPIGDAFDIDFVAHEMGHQFGGSHTFNANTGSCAGNGVAAFSVEPGSGTTIMAYAGICGGGNDFQGNSDAYFHSASLEEISSFITTGNGATCAATSVSPNVNAVVPPFAASYNIPRLTPFELTAPMATDITADELTYCWEQRNTGGADFRKTLAQTRLQGPLFRSFPPTTSRTRIFPLLQRLLNGVSTPGEKLPDTGRSMTFRMTERDVYQGWGTFNLPTDAVVLNVANTSGAFAVTSPYFDTVWTAGTYKTVTWNVSETNLAPISCTNVDILLSIDGGYTYPYTLSANTANDGNETLFIPFLGTTATVDQARVKVRSVGNVFFNINEGNFTIIPNPLGVKSTSVAEAIAISPVPAGAELQVTIPATLGIFAAKLVNPVGQQVWSGTLQGTEHIRVGNFPRGIYYLQLSGNGEAVTRTVVLK